MEQADTHFGPKTCMSDALEYKLNAVSHSCRRAKTVRESDSVDQHGYSTLLRGCYLVIRWYIRLEPTAFRLTLYRRRTLYH